MIPQIFCLSLTEERFVRLSFRTSPPFLPLIPRRRSVPAASRAPSCEFDYYLRFKGLIRLTDVLRRSLGAV